MDHQLDVFVRVAERQSFSRAAEELHLSQPAVTLQIQALERSFGARLFERSRPKVRLTPAGEILLHHARAMLQHSAQARRLIEDLVQRAEGPLSIGASYTVGEYVLPHLLAPFRRSHPGVLPSVAITNTRSVAERVAQHAIDVGIIEGEVEDAGLLVTPLSEDRLVVIVPSGHCLASVREVPPEELAGETWLLREPGSGTRSAAERMLEATGITPKETIQLGSTQAIKESVEAGIGVSLVSRWAIRKELRLGTLAEVSIRGHVATRRFSVVVERSRFRTKALAVFLEFLEGSRGIEP